MHINIKQILAVNFFLVSWCAAASDSLFSVSAYEASKVLAHNLPRTHLEVAGSRKAAVFETIGRRPSMEDAHQISEPDANGIGLYGIYDGHGGQQVAEFCGQHLGARLLESMATWGSADFNKKITEFMSSFDESIETVIKYAPFRLDTYAGSTVILVITDKTQGLLHVIWLGDARAVVIKKDGSFIASHDHKPSDPAEKARIEALGGCVNDGGRQGGPMRVNGRLAVSRALGDFYLKRAPNKMWVSNEPGIITVPWTEDVLGVYLACDGVWDVVSSSQAAATIVAMQAANKTPAEIAEYIAAKAYSGMRKDGLNNGINNDNITSMFVDLRSSI